MADFRAAYDILVSHEGGYAYDPLDRGGETYRGIARRFHPGWGGWKIIDAIKAEMPNDLRRALDTHAELQECVRSYYRIAYWVPIGGDAISCQQLANELFEQAVNLGVGRAVEHLQRALNALNRNGRQYPDLIADGRMGPRTLEAIERYLDGDPPDYLLVALNVLQGAYYLDFMRRSPDQERFARGWLARVALTKGG